jgi:tetratricopeptide (TPR) repeat protein
MARQLQNRPAIKAAASLPPIFCSPEERRQECLWHTGYVRCFFSALVCAFTLIVSAKPDNYLVLPFFNLSKNSNLNWIGESFAESVREALSSEGLTALDREDRVEAYWRFSLRPYVLLTKASVLKIGEELDAEQVLYGEFDLTPGPDSAVNSRGSLQITARLLDLKHYKNGPQFREVGALEDLAALQEHLAWQVLQSLKAEAAPTEAEFQSRHRAVRVDAIESYVRGLLAASADEKHRLYTQAVRLDSHYSQPCFQLGRLFWKKKEYKSAAEWFQKVAAGDAHYNEANFFLGLSRYYTGDYAEAQSAFQLVAKQVPLNEVYNNLGAVESRRNMPDALSSFQKALEGDESDPAYQFNVGYALWRRGNFQAAARSFRNVLDRDPNDAQAALLLAYCEKESGPRPGDPRTEGLERLKTNYQESAYRQLKAVLQPAKP